MNKLIFTTLVTLMSTMTTTAFAQLEFKPVLVNEAIEMASGVQTVEIINRGAARTFDLSSTGIFSISIDRCNKLIGPNQKCNFRLSASSSAQFGENLGELRDGLTKIADIKFIKAGSPPSSESLFQSTSASLTSFITQNISIQNKTASVENYAPTFSGANASNFEITLNRCQNIAPNNSCSISYRLKAVPNGTYSAILSESGKIANQLSISANITNSPIQPQVSSLSVTPNSLDFGTVTKYGNSPIRSVSVTNTGTISFVPYLEKTSKLVYTLNRCTSWLAPGASCSISMALNATSDLPNGAYTAESLTVKTSSIAMDQAVVSTTIDIQVNGSLTYQYLVGEFSPSQASLVACDGEVQASRSVVCSAYSGAILIGPAPGLCQGAAPSSTTTYLSPAGSGIAFSNAIGSGLAQCQEGQDIDNPASILTYDACNYTEYRIDAGQCIEQFTFSIAGMPSLVEITGAISGLYDKDTVLSLSLENNDPYGEVSWAGDCAGTPFDQTCELTMDASKEVYADKVCAMGAVEENGVCLPQFELSVTQPSLSSIVVNPTPGTYTQGTQVNAEYVPVANSEFTWASGPCLGDSNQNCDFELTEDVELSVNAVCSAGTVPDGLGNCNIQYQLTVNQPSFGYTPGVNEISGGQGAYNEGEIVNLSYTPPDNASFLWSGDCSGSGACSVTMDQARTVSATVTCNSGYAPDGQFCSSIYTSLQTNIFGGGFAGAKVSYQTYDPEFDLLLDGFGFSCGLASCTQNNVLRDYVVKGTVEPGYGYTFDFWGQNCNGELTDTCSLTMNGPKTVDVTVKEKFNKVKGMTGNSLTTPSKRLNDGRIVVAGNFFGYNDRKLGRIARLNADGSLDTTFNALGSQTGFNAIVHSFDIDSSGRIIAVGDFTTYHGDTVNRIVRINSDGSRDVTFTPPSYFDPVRAVKVLSNGKIMIGGQFTVSGATSTPRIALLNSNGTLDTSLASGTGFNNFPEFIEQGSDGSIYVGGQFTTYNGVAAQRFAKISLAGALDTAFTGTTGFDSSVYSMQFQSDGKILVGGQFTNHRSVSAPRIVRLNSDGSRDSTFNVGTGFDGSIYDIEVLADGKVVASGDFLNLNGQPTSKIAVMNSDGSKLSTFSQTSVDLSATTMRNLVVKPGNTFVLLGTTTLEVDLTGQRVGSFFNNTGSAFPGQIKGLDVQADGKILAVGNIGSFNGTIVNSGRIVRLNANGSLDTSFTPSGIANNVDVEAVEVLASGKIMIGGQANLVGSSSITRLNANGSRDTDLDSDPLSFFPTSGITNNTIYKIQEMPDGKIWIAHSAGLIRLATDNSTEILMATNGAVVDFTFDSLGRMIIVGAFTTFTGQPNPGIVRLNANAFPAPDGTSFGTGFTSGTARAVAVDSSNNIYVTGSFTTYNGTSSPRIVKINGSNGARDATFNVGTGFNAPLTASSFYNSAIVVQNDGKVIVAGDFSLYKTSQVANGITRLTTTGDIDATFSVIGTFGTGLDSGVTTIRPSVNQINVLSNGDMILSGQFLNFYKGIPMQNIYKIDANGNEAN